MKSLVKSNNYETSKNNNNGNNENVSFQLYNNN